MTLSETLEVTKEQQISIRLEPDLAERAEALSNALGSRPEFRAFRMTRAAVLRMAMLEGLATLEAKYEIQPPTKATARKR
jgi:predicted DNA-binding protein